MTGIERAWLTMGEVAPPFAINLVFEGEGELEAEAWQKAVAEVAAVHPGARARLAGRLGGTRWLGDGPQPRVVVVDGAAWSGAGPEGAAFLDRPFDPTRGPNLEVLLVSGAVPRVVVRAPHAVMDARAILFFMREVCRVLGGDEPLGPTAWTLGDVDLARRLGQSKERPPTLDHLAPTGRPASTSTAITWRRRRVAGAPSAILGRIGAVIAARARASDRHAGGSGGKVRLDVPVDLRRHDPALRSLGNLTGLLRIPVGADASAATIQAEIQRALAAHEEARPVLLAETIRAVPLWLMKAVARGAAKKMLARGRFDTTATISNLGRLELLAYQGGTFRTRRAFMVAPISSGLPLFLTLAGDPEGVEMVGIMPEALASGGRLEALLDAITLELAP
jgi:hypothetical protein